MNGNDFMSWILRSPAYGLLSGMMLITVTGRKTGKKYTLPVEYFEEDGYLWVVSSRERTWWRNLRNGGAEVELLLKHKPASAYADLVTDFEQIETHLQDYLRHAPLAAKPMGIRMQDKTPNDEDLARVAKERLFVRIKLAG